MTDPALLPWLVRWGLTADGAAFSTHSSTLLPVTRGGVPLMLKLSDTPEGRRGLDLMRWWDGDGAAEVVEGEGPALLMVRATRPRGLAEMARSGQDDEATRILCRTALRLHAVRPSPPPPSLMPLEPWFADLFRFADAQSGVWAAAADAARGLLAQPRQVVPLHGDLHHGNVLDFGRRGWLAIDPHALLGDPGFDLGCLFCNPDLDDPDPPTATRPEVFARRVRIVIETAGIEPQRLLRWILAQSGLSAAWFAEDGDPLIRVNETVARMALAALDG